MMPLSPLEAVRVLDAQPRPVEPSGSAARPPRGVSIDSRTLEAGQCFCAIRGPRFDGHDFIEAALDRGARWIIHQRQWTPEKLGAKAAQAFFLGVRDTDRALGQLGAHVRRKWGGPLVAITGSMGKTTTRRFAAVLLSQKYSVLESSGNLNNQYGVPLSLLRLEPQHQIAVLELGMSHPGEIGQLAALCRPEVGVITNVAPVHLEFFPDLAAIAAAKGEILEHLPDRAWLIFNADDPRVAELAARHAGRKLSFSLKQPADIWVRDIQIETVHCMRFTLGLPGRRLDSQLPFAGRHYLYDLAAAAAVAVACDLAGHQLEAAISQLEVEPLRGRIHQITPPGGGTATLWDDSYNSNPEAVRSVLETFAELRGYARKILILGEMRELGEASPELHRQVGALAAQSDADLLITVGAQAAQIGAGASESGLENDRIRHFPDSREAARQLAGLVRPGDLVLCKGSRGIRLERVVQRLTQGTEGAPA